MKRKLILFAPDSAAGGTKQQEEPIKKATQQQQQRELVKLAGLLGIDPDSEPEAFLGAVQDLKNQVIEFDAQARLRAEEEKKIAEKTSVGLSRSQALAVIKRQKNHDEALEKVWAERRADIVQVLKDCKCTSGKVSRDARMKIREIHGAIVLDEIIAAQKSIPAAK
jgi:hypothetical protein